MLPDSDFTVCRTAHRNNNSDYYIGDRKSNFTEVTKLLKGKGIDLDNNRFLILQVNMHSCTVPSFQTCLPANVLPQGMSMCVSHHTLS